MEKVKLDLITQKKLKKMSQDEKIDFLLHEVKKGKVLILERGLNPLEETKLIETTMSRIDQETFVGIELESYEAEETADEKIWHKLLRKDTVKPRITIIGPAEMIKTIYKDGGMLQAMIYKEGKVTNLIQSKPHLQENIENFDEKIEMPINNKEIIDNETQIMQESKEINEQKEIPQMENIKDDFVENIVAISEEQIKEDIEIPEMEIIKEENIENDMLIMEKNNISQMNIINEENISNGMNIPKNMNVENTGLSQIQVLSEENIEIPLYQNNMSNMETPQQVVPPPPKENKFNIWKKFKK